MHTQKLTQYLVIVALVSTIPVYPQTFFGRCADAFRFTKQSVVDVVTGQASTKTTIGAGLAALVITYALIRYIRCRRSTSYNVEKSCSFTSESLVLSLKESDLNYPTNERGKLILQEGKITGAILAFAALKNPGILNSLIHYGKRTESLDKENLDDTLFKLATNELILDKRDSIATLIKNGADINAKRYRIYRLDDPRCKKNWNSSY